MKMLYRWAACMALLLPALPAWSAISCTLNTNPADVKLIYNYFGNADAQGAIELSCTRNPQQDPRRPWFWIGMDQTTTGRTALQEAGTNTLTYEVFHGSYTAGTWTNTGGVAANSTTNGAVRDRVDFGGGQSSSLTDSYTFYLRVPSFQFKPAGVYVDAIPITLRLDNATGQIITTGTLDVIISIPRSCRFSTPPSGINVNYTAFSATAVTGTSNFAITCTQGTTYTIALDATRSVVPNVELAYSLGLSAASATGTAVAQPYTVNISVDAGQAGRCSTSTCTGSDTRTLTVTY